MYLSQIYQRFQKNTRLLVVIITWIEHTINSTMLNELLISNCLAYHSATLFLHLASHWSAVIAGSNALTQCSLNRFIVDMVRFWYR